DKERGQAPEAEQHQPEERGRDAPRALALAFYEQAAEDGDKGRRERRVGDERAHGVRDEERDLERVDRSGNAEDRSLDDLPHQPDDAREPGGDREDDART